MRELLAKRTFTAKHFEVSPGRCLLEAHLGHIHFRDGALKDGVFRDIDTTLEFNRASQTFEMIKASYEAQVGLYGEVRFFNVDHSLEFRLPNPNKVQAQPYNGSAFGRLRKALIWRDILQPGGHQIVEARNGSLGKIFRFERKPASNTIEFQVVGSEGLEFFDRGEKRGPIFQHSKKPLNFKGPSDRLSWIRTPRAWNHRGESVDVALQFFTRGSEIWVRKIIPQFFIDATFIGAGAWLECDTTTSYYTGAGDGYVQNTGSTWSTVRGASVGASANYQAATATVGARYPAGYYIERDFLPDDTSGLTSDANIQSASLFVKPSNVTAGGRSYVIIQTSQASTSSLVLDDFDALILNAPTEGSARIADSAFSVNTYKEIALNASGLTWISKTGWTKIGLREAVKDIDNVAPTDNAFINLYMSEQTGTDSDPYLSVVYQIVISVVLGAAAAVAGQNAPSVQLGSINVTPAASAAIAAKANPSIQIGTNVTLGAASAVGSKADPTVRFGSISITPSASSAIAAKSDPGVQLGAISITPAAAAAVAARSNPSIVLGSISVTPSPSSAIAATKDPRVSSLTWRNTWVNRGPGFIVGDLVMTQRIDFDSAANKFTVYRMLGEVRAIGKDPVTGEEYADIYISEGYDLIDSFASNIEWVVIGNKVDPTRAAVIYMTADETYSPRMELRSGVDSHAKFGSIESLRVAIGNLNGITDPYFGALTGYGLYGETVYLKGKMYLSPGSSIQWSDLTGSGKPADNATVGADWGSNVTGRPTNLVALGDVPGYIKSTYLDSMEVRAPNITGNSILGGNIVASSGSTNTAGLTGEGSGDSAIRIWAGSTYANRGSAPFRVTQGGVLVATSAILKTSTGTKYIDINSEIANEMQFFEGAVSKVRLGSNVFGSNPGLFTVGAIVAEGFVVIGSASKQGSLYVYGGGGANEAVQVLSQATGARTLNIPDASGTFWTSGNQGSGSGLDADLWDGKHMPANAAGKLTNDGNGNLSWT